MKNRVITGSITFLLLSIFLLVSGCDDFSLMEILANDISLIPEEITLNFDESVEFHVSNGIEPFNYSLTGEGTISSSLYTAPGIAGNYKVTVEDDLNRAADAYVIVLDAADLVSIIPEIISTGINGIVQFTISGGTGLYEIDLDPELGVYNTDTNIYTAGDNAGLEIIKVTDSNGNIAEASVTILNTSDLLIIPDVAEVLSGANVITFSASGGDNLNPYIYTILPPQTTAGDSLINAGNGRYSSPTDTGIENVRVTDFNGDTADATVYIVAALLTINPSVAITLYVNDEFTFSASDGSPPYSFSILPGDENSGMINNSTGLFTALAKDNSVTVVVEDSRGATDTCRVKIKN